MDGEADLLPSPAHPVMIVDDEKALVGGYRAALRRAGITNLICHTDGRDALETFKTQALSLVILDLNMPFVTGERLLEEASKTQPGVPVIVVTGKDSIDSVVHCVKQGAYDYLVKPVSADRIVTTARNALQINELNAEVRQLNETFFSSELKHPEYFADIITADDMMRSIFVYIEVIAPTNNPVLLTGETGVGKELIARAIHRASGRAGDFVTVNIAGLDDALFSDTLFGHAKGAFTGADTTRQGLIAKASRGTLFLDEIGDLPLVSQVKLLRLLQEQEYTPLGMDQPVKTDARVVVATNADLSRLQEAGRFRPDLYYRLGTHKIHIPPLRKRTGDIELLLEHLLATVSRRLNKKKPTAPKQLAPLLATYSFPGNIRELEAMVTDAVSRHSSRMLSLNDFKKHVDARPGDGLGAAVLNTDETGREQPDVQFGPRLPRYEDIKRLLVEEAMRRANGNRTRAAELLGTSRQVVSTHLQEPDQPRK